MKIFLIAFYYLIFFNSAQGVPLYEHGVAAGSGFVYDYPAADQGRMRYLIVPSFRYRGKKFRSDRRGTRANFFKLPAGTLDLSFGAAFPASSENNSARKGMDDLDWLGEIGPRLNYFLADNEKYQIQLEIPLRFVFSTDFDFTKTRGQRFVPQIDLEYSLSKYLRASISFKLNWATEGLHDYFYEVADSDVTSDRERYNAKGGFLGSTISTGMIYRDEKSLIVLGVSYNNFNSSVNDDSPLYRVRENIATFVAFNYFYFQSKKQASE